MNDSYEANIPGSTETQEKIRYIRKCITAIDVFLDIYNRKNTISSQEGMRHTAISLGFKLAFQMAELTKIPYETIKMEDRKEDKCLILKTDRGGIQLDNVINLD